jgi:hypothetical protein
LPPELAPLEVELLELEPPEPPLLEFVPPELVDPELAPLELSAPEPDPPELPLPVPGLGVLLLEHAHTAQRDVRPKAAIVNCARMFIFLFAGRQARSAR